MLPRASGKDFVSAEQCRNTHMAEIYNITEKYEPWKDHLVLMVTFDIFPEDTFSSKHIITTVLQMKYSYRL